MAKLSAKLNSALVPLGIVALVAGCGGGSVVSSPGGGTTFVPPGQTTAQTAKATLTLYVPVRGGRNKIRQPQYISPGTSKVSVSVAQAGAPSPWPNATSTSVPTPGPSPASGTPTPIPVTMSVNAPLGSAQFNVNTYDANGYLLSGAISSPMPISSNAASNSITLTLNASAQCLQVNHDKLGFTMTPFENQANAQTATFVVTPCDIDGYLIPAGQQLANQLAFTPNNPNPNQALSAGRMSKSRTRAPLSNSPAVTFSPSAITQGGDTTVTMTYAAGSNATDTQYIYPTQTASAKPPESQAVTANPLSYIFVSNQADNTVTVLADQRDLNSFGLVPNIIGTPIPVGMGPGHFAGAASAAGCSNTGQAMTVSATDGTVSVLTVPTPSAANPTPMPLVSSISGIGSPVTAAYVDGTCTAYIGANGTVYSSAHFGSPATVGNNYSNPTDGSTPGTEGYAPISAITSLSSVVYLGLGNSSGYLNNLTTTARDALTFGSQTDALIPYNATSFAIAYHNSSTGYLHFAIYTPSLLLLQQDSDLGSNVTIYGMVEDSNGVVYAVGNTSSMYRYVPGWSPSPPDVMSLIHSNPTGIAMGMDGVTTYVTDAPTEGFGTLDQYNFPYYSGTSITVGTHPSSVVVVP